MPSIYDPFQPIDHFRTAIAQKQTQSGQIQAFTDEEKKSLLSTLGQSALHGLGYLGGSLSKAFGGRAIRGLIGGKPEEFLSVIPFSDTLGITNPADEVRGSDLLGGNSDTSLLSPEGIGGLGIDILTDPATYLTFGSGALTKLGAKAAASGIKMPGFFNAAGRLAGFAPGAEEAIALAKLGGGAGELLGGQVGLHIPFTEARTAFDISPVTDALGNLLNKIPGSQLAQEAYTRTIPPLFEDAVKGMRDWRSQTIARRITEGESKAISAGNTEAMRLAEQVKNAGLGNEYGNVLLRNAMENAVPFGPLSSQQEAASGIAGQFGPMAIQHRNQLIESGVPSEMIRRQNILSGPGIGNEMGYVPRQASNLEPPSLMAGIKRETMQQQELAGRLERYDGLPTERINQLASEDMSALNPMQIQAEINERYLGNTSKKFNELQALRQEKQALDVLEARMNRAGGNTNPALAQQWLAAGQAFEAKGGTKALTEMEASYNALNRYAGEMAQLKTAGKLPMFENPVTQDIANWTIKDHLTLNKADKIHEGVAEFSVPLAEAGPGAVPVRQFLNDVGMTLNPGSSPAMPMEGAMTKTLEYLKKFGKYDPSLPNPFQNLDNLYIPADMHASMTGFINARSIESLSVLKNVWDSMTNLTKTFQTVLWPSNHARNQLTAMYNNLRVGAGYSSESGPMAYIRPWLDAHTLNQGGVVDGIAARIQNNPIFRGMDDAQASKEIQRQIIQWDVYKNASKQYREFGTPAQTFEQKFNALIPGMPAPGIPERLGQYAIGMIPRTAEEANPFAVSGVAGRRSDVFSPARGGRELASKLDDVNRGSVYVAKLEQGLSPEAAFKASIDAHYDFGNLTQFERGTMCRLLPFYGWMRQNVPSVIYDFLQSPGGITGQSVKAAYEGMGRQPGFTPDMLGEGMAAKIGGVSDTGQQRYLSSTGLPFEDLAQLAQPSGFLGMLNPMLKAPLEMATNRQFFTGRDLSGAVPHTGSTAGDEILGNSPLGRFGTMGRMWLDPRQGVPESLFNTFAGGRLTNVDQAGAERRAIMQNAEELIRNNPVVRQFQRVYVPQDQMQNLTPQELAMLRLFQTVRQGR